MPDTPGIVEADGYRIESTSETAEDMIKVLTPSKSDKTTPREVKSEGKTDEDEDEKSGLSKAAADLGKEGGKAAAAKRAAEAKAREKEAKADDEPAKPDEKPPSKDEADEGESEKPGDTRKDPRSRMLEATRKEAEAKRALAAERAEREQLARRLEALERRTAPPEEQRPPAERQEAQGKPKAEDFEDYEAYLDARDNWNRKQWAAEATRRREAQEYHQRLDSHAKQFSDELDKAEKATPGFREKVAPAVLELKPTFIALNQGQMPSASNWIADELVFNPELAPTLMMHFTEHPDDLERIRALPSPRAVTREMAKLAARLEPAGGDEDGQDKPKPISKAKPPVKPISGSPPGGDPYEVDDDMDYDEHVARMNAKERSARKRA